MRLCRSQTPEDWFSRVDGPVIILHDFINQLHVTVICTTHVECLLIRMNIENNVWVAKLSVSKYLSRWTDSHSERGAVRKRVLTHFINIKTEVWKTVTRLCQERYAKCLIGFAEKNLGKT